MNELITGFKDYPPMALVMQAGKITTALSKEKAMVWFAAAAADREAMAAAAAAYKTALALETSKSVTILRHALRKTLRDKLTILAVQLELIAEGDLVKLVATGYSLRKKPVRREGVPDKPQRVKLQRGPLSGTVKGSCKPDPHAMSYEVQKRGPMDGGDWVYAGTFTDSRNFLITGLEPGKIVAIRVRTFSANGSGAWSDVAWVMVV